MAMNPYVLVLAKNGSEGAKYVRRAKLPRGRWRIVSSASSIRGIRQAHVHALPGFAQRPDRHSILAELRYAKCEWFDVEMPPRADAPAVDQGDGMGQQLTIDDVVDVSTASTFAEVTTDFKDGARLADAEAPGDNHDMAHLAQDIIEVAEANDRATEPDGRATEPDGRRRFPTARQVDAAYRYNRLRDLPANSQVIHVPFTDPSGPLPFAAPQAPKARRRTRCADCGELHFKDDACVRTDGVKDAPRPLAVVFD